MKKLSLFVLSIFLLASCGNHIANPNQDKQNIFIPKTQDAQSETWDLQGVTITSSWVSADDALKILMDWNSRFVSGSKLVNLEYNASPSVREWLAKWQTPYAVVLTCSDSRLPPELIFDQWLWQIFVVRVAWNIVSPHELGSIEYAIEHLGSKLIMVLWHEKCWAVKATYQAVLSGSTVPWNLWSIVKDIEPSVKKVLSEKKTATDAEKVEECIVENIHNVGEWLEVKSPVIKEFVEAKWVKIVRAKYALADWKVTLLEGQAEKEEPKEIKTPAPVKK